jgi:hypothetical protein
MAARSRPNPLHAHKVWKHADVHGSYAISPAPHAHRESLMVCFMPFEVGTGDAHGCHRREAGSRYADSLASRATLRAKHAIRRKGTVEKCRLCEGNAHAHAP